MDKQAKHTPGPWKLVLRYPYRHIDDANGDTICSLPVFENQEAEATAVLIAAAPDLRAALQDLLAQCQKWAPTLDCSRARFALAKSRGE